MTTTKHSTATAFVVFADADYRRELDEDMVCGSKAAADKHCKELRKMGFEPVIKVYADEAEFYAKRVAKRGY